MKKNAFTLIELSIVLVIIGLIIGGSFKVLKTMRERAEVTRAQDDVKVAKEAIIGNTILNSNTLPDVAFFNQNLSPIKTNQHQLFYTFAPNLNNIDVCRKISTNLKLQPQGKPAIDDVAFVVASESSNHNMQTARTNLQADGNYSVNTYDYATKKDDNTSPVNIQENYDDIVDWVTLAQLQEAVKCSDTPLRIVNTSLPSTDTLSSSSYKAKIVVDGNYSVPIATGCTFLREDNTQDSNFHYNSNNKFLIKNDGNDSNGTVTVDCNVTADGKTVSKKFAITIDP